MYHHLNTLTIFPDRLRHNFEVLSKLQKDTQPVPVVKSNAYGHGIKILAPLLNEYDIPFVCVDSLYEAFELEKNGYAKNILIMGYVDPRDVPRRKNFRYAVSDLDYALALVKKYSWIQLHIFLDTGMHREGIQLLKKKEERINNKDGLIKKTDSAPLIKGLVLRSELIGSLNTTKDEGRGDYEKLDTYTEHQLTSLAPNIEGIMSHLASPDNIPVSEEQIRSFYSSIEQLHELKIIPKYTHILASGGLIQSSEYVIPPFHHPTVQLARTGLAFYGYGHPDLLPALRCTTRIAQIKHLQAGGNVGYDGTFTAEKSMKIAVLPIGYHDGLDRRLSGKGLVQIGECLCPIIGRVSMNITTVDISSCSEIAVGDEVIFIDEDPDSSISLERQAECAGMIPYDMLVHLSKEMFRTV